MYLLHIFFFVSTIFSAFIAENFHVYVNTTTFRTVPDRYLSIAQDSNHAEHADWNGLNFTYIEPLAKALGDAYFRFGGTAADLFVFQENQTNKVENAFFNATTYVITGAQIDQLCTFAKNVGWRLIFDLNIMLRNGSKWDSSNAEQLLKYVVNKGYDLDFELGNEPEAFQTQFNYSLTGAQIANDYARLRTIMNEAGLNKSIIIGPSIASYETELSQEGAWLFVDFLSNGGGNYINALTTHYYYMAGSEATVANFTDYNTMNKLQSAFNSFNTLNYTIKWLGETASAYNGGALNISASFADGFLWLDKLGLSAINGIDVVVRQELYGANYPLLNCSMYPNHDYWLSLLYKRLVGPQVLTLNITEFDPNLRLYAASSKKQPTSIIIYGVWLKNESMTLDFSQFVSPKQVTLYLFEEGIPGDLVSQTSTLNGKLLEWTPGQSVPEIETYGNVTNLPIELPGYSQFFIVVDQNSSSGSTQSSLGSTLGSTQSTQSSLALSNFVINLNMCLLVIFCLFLTI